MQTGLVIKGQTEPRVNKGFLFSFMVFMASSTIPMGYSMVVINPNIGLIKLKFNLNEDEATSWIAILSTINSIGAVIGVFSTAAIIEGGRRRAVFMMNAIGVFGAALMLVENLHCIALGRLVLGFGFQGMSIVLSPKYIDETAPLRYKGSLGALTQIMVVFGCFFCSFLGFGVPTDLEEMKQSNYNRVMFAIHGSFGVVHMIIFVFFFNYDTPRYLKMSNQEAKLDELLLKLYHKDDLHLVK